MGQIYDPTAHQVSEKDVKDTRRTIDSVSEVLGKHNPRLAQDGGMKPKMTANYKSTFHNGYMVTAKDKEGQFLVEIKNTQKNYFQAMNVPSTNIDSAIKMGIAFINENL